MADTIPAGLKTGTLSAEERARIEKADAWFDAHRDEFIADLIEWVGFASVSDETAAAPGAPFGPEVERLFRRVIERAEGLGFKTETHDGYAISILSGGDGLSGSGRQEIGLASHLDVVPAGENWRFSPFEPFERDGFVIGRGASDNKGPALLDLYILRAFRDLGIGLDHDIRVIYGGAEETGMADLEYYAQHAPVPRLSIITDGGFPVNFAQKGGLNLVLTIPTGPLLARLSGGVAENAVPASASIVFAEKPLAEIEAALARLPDAQRGVLSARADGAGSVVTARGQSGHSAFPENTRNAIPLLLDALIDAGLLEGADLAAAKTIATILADPWGNGAGTAREDEDTGRLTQNGGLVVPVEGGVDLHIDIRYPISADPKTLADTLLQAVAPLGGSLRISRDARPVHIDRSSPLVELLQDTFDTVAGAKTEPFAMGGGTHARVLPRSITFGPGFGRKPDLRFNGEAVNVRPDFIPEGHGSPHGPDEFVVIDNLKRALRVYVVALPRLDRWLKDGLIGDV